MKVEVVPIRAVLADEPDYLKIADIIVDGRQPAASIVPILESWAPSLRIDLGVSHRQPSRKTMLERLTEIEQAALTLERAIDDPATLEFLEMPPTSPFQRPAQIQQVLRDIVARAAAAKRSPTLSLPSGRPLTGAGRALPPNGSTPREFCAALIVELWHGVHQEYPRPANWKIAGAAQLLWESVGGRDKGWADREESWRPYFKKIDEQRLAGLRAEISRRIKLDLARYSLNSIHSK